jgi:hypothetical protein
MAAQTNPDAQVPVALALLKLGVLFFWEWAREVRNIFKTPIFDSNTSWYLGPRFLNALIMLHFFYLRITLSGTRLT